MDALHRGSPPDARSLERQVWAWRVGASVYAGVTRVGYFVLWVVPAGVIDLRLGQTDRMRMLVTSIGLALVLTPLGRAHARRQFEPVARWLRSGEAATIEDQTAILDQPRRHALTSVLYWVVGAVGASAYYIVSSGGQLAGGALLVVGIGLIGLHSAAFTYLGVERVLRPVAASALVRFEPMRISVLSVRARFLLAFALGPGVTIGGIAGFLALRTGAAADVSTAIWPAVVLGFVDGYALVALAAASVTEPMHGVRRAMGAVFDGDLDVEVGVDASSEVGLLQMGFNRMLLGLRERERLRDLLDQYAGTDVAHRLVEGGVDFVGTEVDASVLMVDLIGSTPFTETTPPAEVVASLNLFFEAVVGVVAAHGGWVNRFVGDAALCVFGAPVPCDDHASRALSAARALQVELTALRADRPWLDAAVGVSSGTLVAANVGSETRHEFAVVGDAANEAARLTDDAKLRPGRVLASGSAIDRAAGVERDAWTEAGSTVLRGRSRPTMLFEPFAAVVAEVEEELRRGRLRPS
jgi:adenylate cyclase